MLRQGTLTFIRDSILIFSQVMEQIWRSSFSSTWWPFVLNTHYYLILLKPQVLCGVWGRTSDSGCPWWWKIHRDNWQSAIRIQTDIVTIHGSGVCHGPGYISAHCMWMVSCFIDIFHLHAIPHLSRMEWNTIMSYWMIKKMENESGHAWQDKRK